ncbi:hypothetical protein [Pseudomonas viridiflava]|uniref:hypothetical protein n=1 Tax=Pseudomonas viridiflava TaxID=33069 RepID=UPI000F028092|nr:hypothetical protein [Pseudomonas viridiflava]
MFITQVTSYNNAWSKLNEDFPDLAAELVEAIDIVTPNSGGSHGLSPDGYELSPDGYRMNPRRILEENFANEFMKLGWQTLHHKRAKINGQGTLSIRGIGHIKRNVAVRFHAYREQFNRWLYTVAPLATKHGFVTLPIAIVSAEYDSTPGPLTSLSLTCTRITSELKALAPLSYNGPFLILGVSTEPSEILITELSANISNNSHNVIINRSLEFPPEHHQAVLGILNYFGTVLRDKYPDTNAKIKIEQDDLFIRLIVESSDGNRETIEKALEDYESVVRGDTKVEDFLDDKLKIMELKQEIRFAEVRIIQQQEMIQFQREHLQTLTSLIGHSLSRPQAPLTIDFKQSVTLNSTVSTITQLSIPEILEDLANLSALTVGEPPLQLKIMDLQDSVADLEDITAPEEAKKSVGLRKFHSFIEEASKAGTKANSLFKTVEGGIDILQNLARKYNGLAEWCGAPQVPKILLGDKE